MNMDRFWELFGILAGLYMLAVMIVIVVVTIQTALGK